MPADPPAMMTVMALVAVPIKHTPDAGADASNGSARSSCASNIMTRPRCASERWADVESSDSECEDSPFGLDALPAKLKQQDAGMAGRARQVDYDLEKVRLQIDQDIVRCTSLLRTRHEGSQCHSEVCGTRDSTTSTTDGASSRGAGSEVATVSETATETAGASDMGDDEHPDSDIGSPWRPNLRAPEFVPTLGGDCLLMGFAMPTGATEVPEGSRNEPCCLSAEGSDVSHPVEAPKRSRRSRRRSRRCVDPHAGAEETAPIASAASSNASGVMPEATEEDWARRGEQRQMSIRITKSEPFYTRWAAERSRRLSVGEALSEDEPLTPNALDRTISKRQWKYDVQQWRLSLREATPTHESEN